MEADQGAVVIYILYLSLMKLTRGAVVIYIYILYLRLMKLTRGAVVIFTIWLFYSSFSQNDSCLLIQHMS